MPAVPFQRAPSEVASPGPAMASRMPARDDAEKYCRSMVESATVQQAWRIPSKLYELIPVFARRPFRLDAHLDRLQRSLDGIRLPNPHPLNAFGGEQFPTEARS